MLFNSIDFAVFVPIVFLLYWFVTHKNLKLQNLLIVAASYVFYGWWDWRFLALILFSTLVDYAVGVRLKETEDLRKRKFLLWTSILVNLGFLGFFKYFNFFMGNIYALSQFLGFPLREHTFNIILPLGISFFILQSLSYTIDIYRKGMKPTSDFIAFALFVAFFPQLVAGPIERARNLLPQILCARKVTLERVFEGCFLFFWGLFLKVFIADNIALIVNPVYDLSPPYNGLQVLLTAYAFTFQIYCDFEGYTCMARGLAKMMGFELMLNFNLPYFITNVQDF